MDVSQIQNNVNVSGNQPHHGGRFKAAIEEYKQSHPDCSDAEAVQAVKAEFQALHAERAQNPSKAPDEFKGNVPPQYAAGKLDLEA